jgi:hypothetical protein
MKLTSTIISLVALFSFASAGDVFTINYDVRFDNGQSLLSTLACSDALLKIDKRYLTFESLPNFPFIGAFQDVNIGGPNNAACGSCWEIIFNQNKPPIYVLAIDKTNNGFHISLEAMNTLTNGRAQEYTSPSLEAKVVPGEILCDARVNHAEVRD